MNDPYRTPDVDPQRRSPAVFRWLRMVCGVIAMFIAACSTWLGVILMNQFWGPLFDWGWISEFGIGRWKLDVRLVMYGSLSVGLLCFVASFVLLRRSV